MKKGGLTVETVEAKLHEYSGNLAAVARSFGVTRQAVHDFVRKRPALLAAANDVREGMKDNAESSLTKAVLKGEAWAVCFYLKTQAKDRGYTEKSELDVTSGGEKLVPKSWRIISGGDASANGHAAHHAGEA